jgi:hypothetical protein
MDDCKIDDDFCKKMADSEDHSFAFLETLHVRRNNISATGLTFLCSALGFGDKDGKSALKRLDIRHNNLKDNCHKVLYGLLTTCENIENIQYTCTSKENVEALEAFQKDKTNMTYD